MRDDIQANAAQVLDDVIALRRQLHEYPELGLDLPKTQHAVLEALSGLGLEPRLGTALSSIVVDIEGGSPGPTILLRGDMDALPMPEDTDLSFASKVENTMHACGHDAHTAMLVGAAKILVQRRDQLQGRVRLMFQPGEEGDGGAEHMIAEGVLDGVDGAFAMHIAPNVPAGVIVWKQGAAMASADEFLITVNGRGGHASTPHWATDPIPIAAEIILAIQSMVTRTINAFDPAVVTVGSVHAGTTNNVIPESAEIEGTMRAVSEITRFKVHENLERIATNIAQAHGATATVDIKRGYPVTVNNGPFAEFVGRTADELFGDGHTFNIDTPIMGAEDFSYVLEKVPGAMVFLGICPPDDPDPFNAPACHSNRMMLHEETMAAGVALHVAVAEKFLELGGKISG